MRYTTPFLVIAALLAALPGVTQERDKCWSCHASTSPGIVEQWKNSKHFESDVGCIDCHAADEADVDAFDHFGQSVAIIVSPLDCATCHEKEFEEQKGSHHAKAGQILGSLDNLLGEVVGGPPAVAAGQDRSGAGL